MRPFGCFSDQKETQPVTPDRIIHARRSAVLDHAAKVGVTAACAAAGISRTTYYRWVGRAERDGWRRLLPKQRRRSRPAPRDIDDSGRGGRPAHPGRPATAEHALELGADRTQQQWAGAAAGRTIAPGHGGHNPSG